MRDGRTRRGIELDGRTARLVELRDDRVVAFRTVTAGSPAQALAEVVGSGRRRPGATTVLWTQDVEVHRLPIRPAPRSAWRAALFAAVEDELFVDEEDVAVAGRVESDDAGLLSGLLAVTSAAAVGEVWALARTHRLALTAPALAVRSEDPPAHVELAVRGSTAEVTLVHAGRSVAVRALPDAAVDHLLGSLHLDRDAAEARLHRVLTGTAQLDATAVDLVDRHVVRIAAQVAEQVLAWRQAGLRTGSAIALTGVGATVPSLPARLQDEGLAATAASPPSGIDVHEIDPWDRFSYGGALSAAGTVLGPGSVESFANRDVEAARLRAADRAAARQRRVVAACGAVAAAGLVATPVGLGSIAERRADARHGAAAQRLAAVATVDAGLHARREGQAVYAAQASGDVRWAEVQRAVEAALPAGAVVESERLARAGSTVTVEIGAVFPGEPFTSVSSWVQRLRELNQPDAGRGNEVTIRSFSADAESREVRASVTVALPLRPPFVERRTLLGSDVEGRGA